MKKMSLILITLLMSTVVNAKTVKTCKKSLKYISCEKVEKSQRDGFCWKGKLAETKKEKICTSKPKRKHKKNK